MRTGPKSRLSGGITTWRTRSASPSQPAALRPSRNVAVPLIGYQDEGFFDAKVRMFEQALKSLNTLPADGRDGLVARLNRVREISHDFGYGVGDDMDFLLAKYTRST